MKLLQDAMFPHGELGFSLFKMFDPGEPKVSALATENSSRLQSLFLAFLPLDSFVRESYTI